MEGDGVNGPIAICRWRHWLFSIGLPVLRGMIDSSSPIGCWRLTITAGGDVQVEFFFRKKYNPSFGQPAMDFSPRLKACGSRHVAGSFSALPIPFHHPAITRLNNNNRIALIRRKRNWPSWFVNDILCLRWNRICQLRRYGIPVLVRRALHTPTMVKHILYIISRPSFFFPLVERRQDLDINHRFSDLASYSSSFFFAGSAMAKRTATTEATRTRQNAVKNSFWFVRIFF